MHYTQTYQLRARGFTLVEMLVVAALAAVVMGASMLYINEYLKETSRTKLVSEQAREMYMLSKATEEWMVLNSKNWTLNTRMTVTTDVLIAATFLPQDFARRIPVAGGSAITGVTPFGDRYNIAAMAAMKDGKRVHRGVVWESGTPIGWGRYARVGLAQGAEPANGGGATSKINLIKNEIARSLNTDWKHPAPSVANVTLATVRGVSGSWTQDVAAYLGVGVTFVTPSVVVLAGWPEYGSVLPIDPTAANDFGTCHIYEAVSYVNASNQLAWRNGACPAEEPLEIHRYPHCSEEGAIESLAEVGGSLTFGTRTDSSQANIGTIIGSGETAQYTDDIASCISERAGDAWRASCIQQAEAINESPTARNTNTIGIVILNNGGAKEYSCGSSTYGYVSPWVMRGGVYGPTSSAPPNGLLDLVCCRGPR